MNKQILQEYIDAELKSRKEKPFLYTENYKKVSDGWIDGFKFCIEHNVENINNKIKELEKKDLGEEFYYAGMYKAIKVAKDE